MRTNTVAPEFLMMSVLAQWFKRHGSGALVGVWFGGGRAANPVYGSAKASSTAFLAGLHN